jgi:hypothetical protein
MRSRCAMTTVKIYFTPQLVNTRSGALPRRTDGQTDLFEPLDQLALAGVLKGSHGDSELLAPREPFLDLDIWWVPRVNVLCLFRFVLGFPARVPLPSIPILREKYLHTRKIQMEFPIL